MKRNLGYLFLVICCVTLFSGCGVKQTESNTENPEAEENISQEISTEAEDDAIVESNISEVVDEQETAELFSENDNLLEVYNDGQQLPTSSIPMIASVSPEEILKGNPILYNRYKTDEWIFEWLVSDYYNEENDFVNDCVLVVSKEDDLMEPQTIYAEAEGGLGFATAVKVENRFLYVDANFDNLPDLLICTGHHGTQGLITYYCFLQSENGFHEAPTFTDIANPAIDAENKMILSQWRNSAVSHSWAEYIYQDGIYSESRVLTEDLEHGHSDEVWVWTVDGEEIGRSDSLTTEEIDNLLYNENSEWRITSDRWRTLYNDGLTADFSIYSEP